MRIQRLVSTLLVMSVLSVTALTQDEHEHHLGAPPAKLGSVNFENSCKPEVQATFTRAVALLHSFWYDEAARQFRAVAQQDPACGMAWWGVGMSLWHPLWEPAGPNPDKLKLGQEALQRAKAAGARTEREKGYIAALNQFYDDFANKPHVDRTIAYESAMSELHSGFPKDRETTIFYALALLGSAGSSGPDKTYARQLKAGGLLEPLVSEAADHPGVAHYIIHAYDYPSLAPKALAAARSYAKIAPDAPHALHMPSHIFTRLGLWQESIDSNLASAAAARKNSLVGDELHALDYLEFAYLQTGQDHLAEEIVHKVSAPHDNDAARFAGMYADAAIPARYVVERRQWAQAAALPTVSMPGGRYAWADATVYFARALGAARTGKIEQAKAELAKIAASKQTLMDAKENYWATQVEIQRRAASAWVQFTANNKEAALAEMRSAVELEDTTDKHPVTPGAVVPMRVLLGDMLLEMKRPAEALSELRKLLDREPNRFAAIYGLARAADMSGDRKLATQMYKNLSELCAHGNAERDELKEARLYLSSEVSRR